MKTIGNHSCSTSGRFVAFAIHIRYPFGFLSTHLSSTILQLRMSSYPTVWATVGSCLRAFPLMGLLTKSVSSSSPPQYALWIICRKFICRWEQPQVRHQPSKLVVWALTRCLSHMLT